MSTFRAILVAVVALAVAVLPVEGGMVRAEAAGMSATAMPSDCCPHTKPCEKKTADDCGSTAGCALKCFNFSGISVSGVVAKLNAVATVHPALAGVSSRSNPTAPPLPPPRV
jgi:hypothetical protein